VPACASLNRGFRGLIANLLQKTSIQSIATHRYLMRVCVSFVVYCKPNTKDEYLIDSNASLYPVWRPKKLRVFAAT
jgi:hypothetical protein